MREDRAEQLADGLLRLLDDEREAVILKHVHDWKVVEIAAHLGRSPEGVAGLCSRQNYCLSLRIWRIYKMFRVRVNCQEPAIRT